MLSCFGALLINKCFVSICSFCCRILHTCHGVLYKQMASWMLHGLLLDQLSEFFIQQSDKDTIPAVSEAVAEDELGLGGITGRQLQQIMVGMVGKRILKPFLIKKYAVTL